MFRNTLSLLFLFLLVAFSSAAQAEGERVFDFLLNRSDHIVSNSLYSKISLIDLRKDTVRAGQVRIGLLNKPFILAFRPSVSEQVSSYFHSAIDSSAGKGEMVLCLRKLAISERPAFMEEEGFCDFSAELYEKVGTNYYLIQSVDEDVSLTDNHDVTSVILQKGKSELISLIQLNLKRRGNQQKAFLYDEIVYADSFARQKMALYSAGKLADGVYFKYASFKNQVPDLKVKETEGGDKLTSVTVSDYNGSSKTMTCNDMYAVVVHGKPYVTTPYGFYPLSYDGHEFSFVGKVNALPKYSHAAAIFMSLTLISIIVHPNFYLISGGLLLTGLFTVSQVKPYAYFLMTINDKDGRFTRIRELPYGIDNQ
ncbi:MAG: hypothetical protein Q8914_10990 [Bacteroidota bacterium]|nr:hypothetical protein [Bacteroidota bacterium]